MVLPPPRKLVAAGGFLLGAALLAGLHRRHRSRRHRSRSSRSRNRRGRTAFSEANPLRVHVLRDLPEDSRATLHGLLNSNVRLTSSERVHGDGGGGAHIVVAGFGKGEKAIRSIEKSKGSKTAVYLIPYAGVDPKIIPALKRAKLQCFNCHHNAPIAAELAVSLVLAAAKQTVRAHQLLARGDWTRRGLPLDGVPAGRQPLEPLVSLTLEGGLAIVLGIRGRIGQRVALALAALGMRVIGTSSSLPADAKPYSWTLDSPGPSAATAVVEVFPMSALVGLLPGARCCVVCTPLTRETEKIIGRDAVAAMGPRCVLVNVARGECVDGAAVHGALEDRGPRHHLFAFASDVWWVYPKSFDEANGNTPPVVPDTTKNFATGNASLHTTLSGHRGGAPGQKDTEERRWRALAEAFNHAADQGDPEALGDSPSGLVGRVDLNRGY